MPVVRAESSARGKRVPSSKTGGCPLGGVAVLGFLTPPPRAGRLTTRRVQLSLRRARAAGKGLAARPSATQSSYLDGDVPRTGCPGVGTLPRLTCTLATRCKTLYQPLHGGHMDPRGGDPKKKDLAAFASKSLIHNANFGSSTRARTWDLRINRIPGCSNSYINQHVTAEKITCAIFRVIDPVSCNLQLLAAQTTAHFCQVEISK